MKRYLILILLLVSFSTYAQQYKKSYKSIQLLEPQTFYLNSGTRIGGKTRISLKVDLPKNTIKWYYAFSTVKRDRDNNEKKITAKSTINLTNQVGKALTSLVGNANISTLIAQSAFKLVAPTGARVCDIYLADYNGSQSFKERDALGFYKYTKPANYPEGTRENYREGVVPIDDLKRGSAYLCFRNPSPTEGIIIMVEATAIVETIVYEDVWSQDNIDKFYNSCKSSFTINDPAVKDICECYQDKFLSNYKPSAYSKMATTESQSISSKYLNDCFKETGNENLKEKRESASKIIEEINALTVLNDYSKLSNKYKELVALGYDDVNTCNSAGWYFMLNKDFTQALEYYKKGLMKEPNNLYLLGNIAHLHIIEGRYKAAEKIYLENRKERLDNRMKWKDMVKEDFELFEDIGLGKSSDLDRIRALLKIKKK
ncbi:MAG: tetratricopeptide repeat protein [Flammeovirgaceae bacterium]